MRPAAALYDDVPENPPQYDDPRSPRLFLPSCPRSPRSVCKYKEAKCAKKYESKLPATLKEIEDYKVFVKKLKKVLHEKMFYDIHELLQCDFWLFVNDEDFEFTYVFMY